MLPQERVHPLPDGVSFDVGASLGVPAVTAHRALTVNISDTGLYVNKVLQPMQRANRVVALEFELPGTGETIWARGEITHDALDDYFHGQGIRFTGMAQLHARLLRDYCIEKRRAQLGTMLEKIRKSRLH